MHKIIWLIFSFLIATVLFQNCSPMHSATGELGSAQSVFGMDMSVASPKFEATLKPFLRANCAACHGTNQSPLFAVEQSDLALSQISNFGLINLTNPASSKMVIKLNGGHSGFGPNEGAQLQAAIQNFANLVDPGSADLEAPIVAMATPASGATMSGSFMASANATDNIAVVGVQFYVDGNIYGSEVMTSPYFVNINSLTLVNGSHSITARARDAAGNFTTSSALSFMVNNVVTDTIAPLVSITAPSSAATVSGTVNVSASASDAVGVVGVQFFIDGVALGAEDLTSPYGTTMNAALFTNGSHSITARARDAAGNNTTSAVITVTVNNPVAAPTYSWIAANILTPKCVSCHGASGANAGRGFNSYSRTMTSVKAGSATTSILYTSVTTGKMSKAPYPILSTTDRNAIRDWINAGALNN